MNQPSERPKLHEGVQLMLREGGVSVLKHLEEVLPILLAAMGKQNKPFNTIAVQIQGIPKSIQQYIDGESTASDYPNAEKQMERLRLVLQYVQGAMGRGLGSQSRRTPIPMPENRVPPASPAEMVLELRSTKFSTLLEVSREIGLPLEANIEDIDLIRRAMRSTLKLMGEEKMLEAAPDTQFEKKGSYLNGQPIGSAAKILSKVLAYQSDGYVKSALEAEGAKRKWVAQRIREQIARLS